MFEKIKAFFATPPTLTKKSWVTFERGGMKVDIQGFLKSPEGKKCLADATALTGRLIAEGKIIDLTKR